MSLKYRLSHSTQLQGILPACAAPLSANGADVWAAAGEDGGGLAHEYGFGPVENPAGRVFVQVLLQHCQSHPTAPARPTAQRTAAA
jgi:hypothetical protein